MTRPIIALLLLLLFFAVAFGLRTWQQLRATGSTGMRGVSGRPGSPEWFGGVLFVVALVVGVAAPIVQALGLWAPPADQGWLSAGLGGALMVLGIAATYGSQRGMGSAWRIGVDRNERTTLVVDGAFAVVRNPIFSCMLAAAIGQAIFLGDGLSWAAFVCLSVAVELQVRLVEEPHLARLHGDVYREYAARVGRFVPGVGRRG